MLKQVIEAHEILDDARVTGKVVAQSLNERGLDRVAVEPLQGEKTRTDVVVIRIPGQGGKTAGGSAKTLGIIGKVGGIGARPERIGMVSDAEGAVAALACAFKLAAMRKKGDFLRGDIIITTHICPDAPTKPHDPVPFMEAPVAQTALVEKLVADEMDALLSVDTTRGNRIANHRGFAITPTVRQGYILRLSEDLLDLMQRTTGALPYVCPITMQDITPYGNGIYHLNSIMQPSVVTSAPVVGVALTTEMPVPGCATGANRETDVEEAARFCLEVGKAFTEDQCAFYDEKEFARLVDLYGPMRRLQKIQNDRIQ